MDVEGKRRFEGQKIDREAVLSQFFHKKTRWFKEDV